MRRSRNAPALTALFLFGLASASPAIAGEIAEITVKSKLAVTRTLRIFIIENPNDILPAKYVELTLPAYGQVSFRSKPPVERGNVILELLEAPAAGMKYTWQELPHWEPNGWYEEVGFAGQNAQPPAAGATPAAMPTSTPSVMPTPAPSAALPAPTAGRFAPTDAPPPSGPAPAEFGGLRIEDR